MPRRFTLLLLFAALALPASAQDFVLYPFSTNLSPTVVEPGVTPALGLATLSNSFIGDDGFGNVLEAYPIPGSTSAALALANNSFFTLSLSITPGTFGPVVVNFNVARAAAAILADTLCGPAWMVLRPMCCRRRYPAAPIRPRHWSRLV